MSELTQVIESPDFRSAVGEMAQIAIQKGVESALAVYRGDAVGDAYVSRVLDSSETTHGLSVDRLGFRTSHYSLDVSSLVFEGYDDDELFTAKRRRDIALLMHTHPKNADAILSSKAMQNTARPSGQDLDTHESIAADNPGLVDGILVANEHLSLAALLLYRRTDPTAPNYYQACDNQLSGPRMVEEMKRSGFSTALLVFDIRKGEYVENPELELRSLVDPATVAE